MRQTSRVHLDSLAGWFNDIFDAKLSFDESCYTTTPDAFRAQQEPGATIPCFDGKATVSGKLLVAAPEGRTISHNGIDIIFFTRLHHPEGTSDVVAKVWTLLDAGSISEAVEVGFDIDLPELRSVLRDTFNGQHMSLRHSLGYRIVRPW